MEQQANQLDRQKFCCSICLELLKDPVTIPCGHSYCMNCINSFWSENDEKETHSCPQCRLTFTPRPALVKNTMLADLVEELKKIEASSDHCYAGLGDVACDACTDRKLKALKSCLQCLASYCEQHLQPHYKSPAFKKHKLVNPGKGFQENICSRHNEVMKIFCRTDQICICILCSMDEHKGHDTVSAAAEMAERQKELGASRRKIQQRTQAREKDVEELQRGVEAINNCADSAVRESEKIITEVKQQIRSRQKAEVVRAKEFQDKLEQEISELRRKDAELQQLSNTEDYTEFLNKYPALSRLSESSETPGVNTPQRYFEDVTAAVSEARGKLQDVLAEEWSKISLTDAGEGVLLQREEPKTREDFLKYTQQITLDPNTANKYLRVDINRMNMYLYNNDKPPHPDRFTSWPQVLCSQTLTGRCYWEVEWQGEVFVALAYTNISRTGNESTFGNDEKCWALQCSQKRFDDYYQFRHKSIRTSIPGPLSSRVGMYLDHSAGVLSFYSVSQTMTLLHRVQTAFTQPLCPGFGAYYEESYVNIITTAQGDILSDLFD